MMEDICKFLEKDVDVSNDECKCVNVERGLPVKKYHKWYIFQPTFDLPTFIVELKGPKSNIAKANIEENQMTLKNKKYFIVKSNCDVCLNGEEDGVEMQLLCCNELHMCCSTCIPKLPHYRCPVCKTTITVNVGFLIFLIFNAVRNETYAIPLVSFKKYVRSWVFISLYSAVKFENFQDADWKKMVKTYIQFTSPYAVAVAIKFIIGDWIFSSSPPSMQSDITFLNETRVKDWHVKCFLLTCILYFNFGHLGRLLIQMFAEILFIILFQPVYHDIWWLIFCFLVFNINRLAKHFTNHNIGIDFTHLGPTMLVLACPFFGVLRMEYHLSYIHQRLVVSLLQSLKNYKKVLLVVATVLSGLIWALWIRTWGLQTLFEMLFELKYKHHGENEGDGETVFFVRTCWNILAQIALIPLLLGHISVTFPIILGIFELVKKVLVSYFQYMKNSLESLFIPKFDFVI